MNQVNEEIKPTGDGASRLKIKQGFTPGPWMAWPNPDCDAEYQVGTTNDDDGWRVCLVAGYAGANDFPRNQESETNARLIAAAPALYEALQAWVDEPRCASKTCCGDRGYHDSLLFRARAALALVDDPTKDEGNKNG